MLCDLNRSINVGFLTSIVISIISYYFVPGVNNLDSTKLLFLFVVFFVIATSMDYFNYCRTICDNFKSSLTYGVFTVSLIYIFYGLFVKNIYLSSGFVIAFGTNILLLSMLHYFLCNIRTLNN
jgi:hypothetical protein